MNETETPLSPHDQGWKPGDTLRQDGPTLEEYVAAGYKAENYPPTGYAARASSLFFKKVLFNMTFFVNKQPVNFEPLASNLGVLKIAANDPVAAALTASARANRGGIVAIDEATYEDLKKNLPFKPLVPKSVPQKLRVLQTEPPNRKVAAGRSSADAASVVVVKPLARHQISDGDGVVVGGGGTGDSSGKTAPVPALPPLAAPPPGEFQPATGKKNFKMPVNKKPTGRSLSGGVPEPAPVEE